MKPLVIYHANCADGFGAAFAAWLKLGDNAQYLPWQYTDPKKESVEQEWERLSAALLPEGNTGREVYILDFSFRREIMDKLIDVSAHFVWRDHHKTAFEMWCERYEKGLEYDQLGDIGDTPVDIFLDDNKSGAMLAWKYFHPDDEIPPLIQRIDDYDRWQFKLIDTKEFNKALWSYAPWSFEQWRDCFCWLTPENDKTYNRNMITEGAAILRAHEQNVRAVVKGAGMKCHVIVCAPKPNGEHWESVFLVDAEGMMANCPPHLQSDVGHQLANACGTFGLLWHINHEGKVLCSLRGAEGYDTTPIAKAFGGGGHAAASGFTCPDFNTLLSWMRP